MKKLIIPLLIVILTNSIVGIGQTSDSIPQIGITVISQVNQGNSYITFPTDIGNLEPLWFEGNLIPNFYLRQSKNSRLVGVITPQVIIRMYQEESYPVRSPSYIPQLTIYYSLIETGKYKNISLFSRIAHHSNGQEGSFYLDNGDINTKSGDFSTNFFEEGITKTNFNKRFNAFQFFKSSLEVHPQSWSSDELAGIYSTVRWHNAFSIFKLYDRSIDPYQQHAGISVKGEAIWMFGAFNGWKGTSLNRLNLNFTFYYHPHFLEDIGLFINYYHGLDYYNMSFNHQIDVLRFGIMTDKLKF
jgi:hypothetical protein